MASDNKSDDAYYLRGLTYKLKGNHQQAIDDLRRSIALDPENEHRAQKNIGQILYEQGKFENASGIFKKALIAGPECDECWQYLAQALKRGTPDRVPALLRASSLVGRNARIQPSHARAH
jgi:tetratricopeptide (TPR) repeat protein